MKKLWRITQTNSLNLRVSMSLKRILKVWTSLTKNGWVKVKSPLTPVTLNKQSMHFCSRRWLESYLKTTQSCFKLKIRLHSLSLSWILIVFKICFKKPASLLTTGPRSKFQKEVCIRRDQCHKVSLIISNWLVYKLKTSWLSSK